MFKGPNLISNPDQRTGMIGDKQTTFIKLAYLQAMYIQV